MKIISHRGNIQGPELDKENSPPYIDSAISLGFEVEVDLRFISGQFWLGHDKTQYKIDLNWMEKRKDFLWFHCKNLEASLELVSLKSNFKFFCHSQDNFILTSTNHIWCHELTNSINNNCIIPLIAEKDIELYKFGEPYAVCTDYVFLTKEKI